MRAYIQTRFGVPGGNCFETAIASIIEDPSLTRVYWGHDDDGGEHWYLRCARALKKRGYCITWWAAGHGDEPTGYCVASGTSTVGTPHSVVWQGGRVAHDPHPRNAGLASIEQWYLVYRALRGSQGGTE